MLERLHFWVMYVGSAALAAFLAVCLTSPQVSTFRCHVTGANGAERCELEATVAAFSAVAGEMTPEDLAAETLAIRQETVGAAAAQ